MTAKVIEHPAAKILRVENERDLAVDALSELYQAYCGQEIDPRLRSGRMNAALAGASRVLRAILEEERKRDE